MFKQAKKHVLLSVAALTAMGLMGTTALAKDVKTGPASYQTVTEIKDWGAAVTKVIVDIGKPVPVGSVSKDTFDVHVKRSDSRLEQPFLEEGSRVVTNAYVSDRNGDPVRKMGRYVVLEMTIGPAETLGSPLHYDAAGTGHNDWIQTDYTITQQEPIRTKAGEISGLVVEKSAGGVRELVDDFSTGDVTYDDVTLTYASYAPEKDRHDNPLVIWLHGGGEGGTDPTIPLSANKAVNFASDDMQAYFDGAYVLAPQAPTKWMDGVTGIADGTSIYEEALTNLITDYVESNPDIDPDRIYIGGASNGGYMTMLMIRDNPGYFAAAFPVCEGLNDRLITDADIQAMAKTPTWFVTDGNDPILPPSINSIPTYERLVEAGADDVHLTLLDGIQDPTGLYTNADGTPYTYHPHFSWVPVFNNEIKTTIDGEDITLMEWLAAHN